MESGREFLRHTIATLAYRGGKAISDLGANPSFAQMRISESSRTPVEVLAHVCDLLDWALTMARGQPAWKDAEPQSWAREVERYFVALERLDAYLASTEPLSHSPEKIFQGPIADALTHVGQIGMLRRVAGAAVRGENYFLADIRSGRVGPDQASPRREFE